MTVVLSPAKTNNGNARQIYSYIMVPVSASISFARWLENLDLPGSLGRLKPGSA
jgi:hypothetical protein